MVSSIVVCACLRKDGWPVSEGCGSCKSTYTKSDYDHTLDEGVGCAII